MRHVTFCTLALFVCQVVASNVSATDAKALFQEGNELFLNGEYESAATRFRAAYEARPSYKILYNLGQSEAAAKRYGVALESFEKYLADGGDEVKIDRQKEVREEIRRLREMTGFVEVEAPEGAVIFIDDLNRGVFPTTQRIPVAGTVVHTFKAVVNDKEMSRKVRVSGGDTVTVKVRFDDDSEAEQSVAETEGDVPVETIGDESSKIEKLRLAGWVLTGVGVGALVGGSVCGGLFLNTENMLESKCKDNLACKQKDQDLIDKRDMLVVTSAALWIGGGVIAASGLGLVLAATLKNKKTENETSVGETVSIVPSANGISVMGRF